MASIARDDLVDVVADETDFRDRQYASPLVALPAAYPAVDTTGESPKSDLERLLLKYEGLVKDQGKDGPCTGYALAGVINFLKWSRSWRSAYLAGTKSIADIPKAVDDIEPVSGEMLYEVTRLYNSGATHLKPRDVMKVWRRHGVCLEKYWGKLSGAKKPDPHWRISAADCTINAYYRVYQAGYKGRQQVSDIQAAVYETGAVYATGNIHNSSWQSLLNKNPTCVPIIPVPVLTDAEWELKQNKPIGHAYAIVGYNSDGFIVLNSWGKNWGFNGFAIVTYSDWETSGQDVWVAGLGVPTRSGKQGSASGAMSTRPSGFGAGPGVRERESGSVVRRRGFGMADPVVAAHPDAWSLERAYNHSVVIDDDGTPLSRLLEVPDRLAALKQVCRKNVLEAFASDADLQQIAVFAHGGLEPEEASLRRAAVLGPYFYENGVYPIFISGQSGFMEPLGQMLISGVQASRSALGPRMDAAMHEVVEAWTESPGEMSEARDAQIEKVCLRLIRPLWTQFKQDAQSATRVGGALYEMARSLEKVVKSLKSGKGKGKKARKPGVHLIGHSAGAVLIGELLTKFKSRSGGIKAASCTLFAPACSTAFAERRFGWAVREHVLKWGDFHLELLSDENERRDNVASIYGKSFLYLMSRALEGKRFTPILGLDTTWSEDNDLLTREFGLDGVQRIKSWRARARKLNRSVHTDSQIQVSPEGECQDAAHGLFDNNVPLMTRTIQRVSGLAKLRKDVGTLKNI